MLTATDKGTIRIVVIAVAFLAAVCVGGVIALSIAKQPIPSVLEVTTGVLVGGLITILTSTRSGAGAAEAVGAMNDAKAAGLPVPEVGQVPELTEDFKRYLAALGDKPQPGAPQPIVVNLAPDSPTNAAASAVPVGPVDASHFPGYETGPADPPSAAALLADTKGVAPA